MDKTMTASKQKPMTDGQIDDLANKLRDAARKHRNDLASEAVQEALGTDNLGMVLFAPFRKLVEMTSSIFTRHVSGVNRVQSPQDALDATGRKQHPTQSIVDAMPRGEGENVELKFFELDYEATPTELDAEYERRNLKADPFALLKYMEDNPAFADERSVVCQWDLGEDGMVSFMAFYRWCGKRSVDVLFYGDSFNRRTCFAGVCK